MLNSKIYIYLHILAVLYLELYIYKYDKTSFT